MKNRETNRPATTGQAEEIAALTAAAMTKALAKMGYDRAQAVIGMKSKMKSCIVLLLLGAEDSADGGTSRIPVDYSRRLDAMIADGRYDYVNPDVTEKHFPSQKRSKEDIDIKLFHFDRVMSSDEMKSQMDREGYLPATIEELLAFGATYQEKQREFPIVALGSAWQSLDYRRRVPYLYRRGSGRYLSLHWYDGAWRSGYRFAGVGFCK